MFKELKVVELSNVLAGPMVGMFFSELNAKVIKVENKTTEGDMTRRWKLPSESHTNNTSAYYSSVNYNKEVLFVDFKCIEEKNKVLKHIENSDIVIANYKPGSAEKLGMDYRSLKKINPSLIYGHISGFGKNSNRPAFDLVLQAETGFMSMNGQPDSPPTKMPVALIDVLTAHQLKEGILIALWQREKTGKGAYVETSLYESAIASLANQASNWLMAQHIPTRSGSLHPNIAPYGEVFKTKDGKEFTLAIGTEKQFNALLEALYIKHLTKDQRFQTNADRVKNRNLLFNYLNEALVKINSEILFETFDHLKIPFGIIKNVKEVFENNNAKNLVLEERLEGCDTKRVKTVAFKIS